MKLTELKTILSVQNKLSILLEDGTAIPAHFHVTEIGMITKSFIDCGGTIREEKTVNFQLWYSNDIEHRLLPEKLLKIIELSESKLMIEDAEIEVEYQNSTIGKYALAFDGTYFILKNKNTACLATDQCQVPPQKQKINLSQLQQSNTACCTPNSGCC